MDMPEETGEGSAPAPDDQRGGDLPDSAGSEAIAGGPQMSSKRETPAGPASPETSGVTVSSNFLAAMRGQRVRFRVEPLPGAPPAVEALGDPLLKQYAKDAWAAASRLEAATQFWSLFVYASRLRQSIADETQQAVVAIFPELKDAQAVLDHLAALPPPGDPQEVSGEAPFPAQQFSDLVAATFRSIRQNAQALVAIGVCSPAFSASGPHLWDKLASVLDGPADFTRSPPVVPLKPTVQPELLRLAGSARVLRGLLETAPAAALALPKHSSAVLARAAPPPPRLSADVPGGTITLDGNSHYVSPAEAAFVRALIAAEGHWRSSRELGDDDAELVGVRVDRVRNKLPEPVRVLVEVRSGAGYRLRVEALE
jgi:hypothetical protein